MNVVEIFNQLKTVLYAMQNESISCRKVDTVQNICIHTLHNGLLFYLRDEA